MTSAGPSRGTTAEQLSQLTRFGIDAGISDAPDAAGAYSIESWQLSVWQIENQRFDKIEDELKSGQPIDLGSVGPTSKLVLLDPKSREVLKSQFPATFLFVTREGGRGVLQLLERSEDGQKISLQFRMWDRAVAAEVARDPRPSTRPTSRPRGS